MPNQENLSIPEITNEVRDLQGFSDMIQAFSDIEMPLMKSIKGNELLVEVIAKRLEIVQFIFNKLKEF